MKSILYIKYTIILFFILFGYSLIGQSNWAFHAPGIAGNAPTSPLFENCIDRDPLGNIFVSSTVADSIQFGPFAIAGYLLLPPPNETHMENAYLAKMNGIGEVQWVNMISSSVYSRIYDLKTDQQGNVYVLGNVLGDAIFGTEVIPELEEMFLAKYKTTGELDWVTTTTTPPTTNDPPQARTLAIADDGTIAVSGSMTEETNFQSIYLDVGPEYNFFIATYSPEGNAIWARGYGYPNPLSDGIGIDYDSDNNIYLTGSTMGESVFDTIAVNSTEGGTYFLSKFDADGNIAWMDLIFYKTVRASDLSVDRQFNQIYVTGYFGLDDVQFGDYTLNLAFNPGRTMFIAKYNGAGQVLWAKANYGDVHRVRAKDVDLSPDGSIFICGEYGYGSETGIGVVFGEGADAVTLKNRGPIDGYMVKYKSDGTVDWGIPFAGPENDDAKGVCAYSNEIGLVSGILTDSIYIGDTAFSSQPIYYSGNFYLASSNGASSPSWIFEPKAKDAQFDIYPNPSPGMVSIKFDNYSLQTGDVKIYNLSGQLLIHENLPVQNATIKIDGLSTGLYIFRIDDEKGTPLGNRKLLVK